MKKYTTKQKQLALDWAHREITHAEVRRKLKTSSMGAYVSLALILREVINELK